MFFFLTFRLNLDDWAIFLSKQKRDRHQIDLLNDFICIINGGAFEIKLCFNESSEDSPMVKSTEILRRVSSFQHSFLSERSVDRYSHRL